MRTLLAAAIVLLSGIAQAQQFPTRPVTLIVPWPGGWRHRHRHARARARDRETSQAANRDREPVRRGGNARARQHGSECAAGWLHGGAASDQRFPDAVHPEDHVRSRQGLHLHHPPHWLHVRCGRAGGCAMEDVPGAYRLRQGQSRQGQLWHARHRHELHITMEQIAKQKGIKWTQVPFKGGADNMNALLGGHIDVTADSTGWAELVNAGKFRLLVTWGAERTKNWPNVPTLKEVGIDMISNSPFGIGGPKGMDPAVVKVLHDAFKKGMEEQSYKDVIAKLDMEPYYMNTADYHAFAMQQTVEQKQLIEELGLKQQ